MSRYETKDQSLCWPTSLSCSPSVSKRPTEINAEVSMGTLCQFMVTANVSYTRPVMSLNSQQRNDLDGSACHIKSLSASQHLA